MCWTFILTRTRISLGDIKPIRDNAINEKEITEHKSTAALSYELCYKGKTPLEVAIILNLVVPGNSVLLAIFEASPA